MTKFSSLVHLNQRQLLSPIWEHYIHAIWQPEMQRYLDEYDARSSSVRWPHQGQLETLKRDIAFHPFNMSCNAVNKERSEDFLYTIEALRELVHAKEFAGRAWWPQSAKGLIKAIEAEQECKQRGGNREEQIEAAARHSGSWINTVGLLNGGQHCLEGD